MQQRRRIRLWWMCLPLNNGREVEVDLVTPVGDGGETNSQALRLEKSRHNS